MCFLRQLVDVCQETHVSAVAPALSAWQVGEGGKDVNVLDKLIRQLTDKNMLTKQKLVS
jgi:hypothetical protein